MRRLGRSKLERRSLGAAAALALIACGCALTPYEARHEMLRDSSSQIWKADVRQVQARAAQSHVFDGATRRELLHAIVTAMQPEPVPTSTALRFPG